MLLAGAALGAVAAWWWIARVIDGALQPGWQAVVQVLAGDGETGTRGGPVEQARFSDPYGVAAAADGRIFVADAGESQSIRMIAEGHVWSLTGGARGFADGPPGTARFDTPSGLALAADGSLYVADTANNAVRRVAPDGHVTTVAGDGRPGHRDGPAHQARFNGPLAVAVDATGAVFVADTYNDRLRRIDPDGTVSTIAGDGTPGHADGDALAARFDTPSGIAMDTGGVIYVADTGTGTVRVVSAGEVTTWEDPLFGRYARPVGIAVGEPGTLYVTDDRGRILELTSDGTRVLAGSRPGYRDGPGDRAQFRRPRGVAVVDTGRLVVADAGNALLRLVGSPAHMDLRPPASPRIAPAFDADAFRWGGLLWPAPELEGPHEIAGTLGEARGGEAERLHTGIDVRLGQGAPVRAVRDGTVADPVATDAFGSLNEWLRIGPLTYVHVRAGRTARNLPLDAERFVATFDEAGQLVRMRVKRGARFSAGETIATVNAFNHVHLNVGWPGEEYNPLSFNLVQFVDTVPPTIPRGGVRLYDEHGAPLNERQAGRVPVRGRVRIVVEAWDQVDDNRPWRRLGVYALGYRVLDGSGAELQGAPDTWETIVFDRLSPDPRAAGLIYAEGSGIPFYGRRVTRFLYNVTNTLRDGSAAEGWWDTTTLLPGEYTLRVRAADIHGNEAIANRDLQVRVLAPADPPISPDI